MICPKTACVHKRNTQLRALRFHRFDCLAGARVRCGFDAWERFRGGVEGSIGCGPESDADFARSVPYKNFRRVRERSSRAEWNQAVARNRETCALQAGIAEIEAVIVGNTHGLTTNGPQIFDSRFRCGNDLADACQCARCQAIGLKDCLEIDKGSVDILKNACEPANFAAAIAISGEEDSASRQEIAGDSDARGDWLLPSCFPKNQIVGRHEMRG